MSQPKQDQVIFQTTHIDSPIYIKEQKGHYQRVRRLLSSMLLCLFIVIPFFQYQGQQAVLFDLTSQKLHFFSFIFYPHDLLLFVFIFIIAAFLLFVVSKKYGRVWCGFTCPQTIWTLLFVWVEHRIEGNRAQRIALDSTPLTIKKIMLKTTKHFIWLLISALTSLVFMSYFNPVTSLYTDLVTGNLSSTFLNWTFIFLVCTYINAGWIREKMCEHMCPYSRFQSVMFNESTSIVTYNNERGEQRGARKLKHSKPAHLGDCVDCNLCVHVCPVGIDIREGLQYQCISCGLCIDACDQVMARFGYKERLISFAKTVRQTKNTAVIFYTLTIIALAIAFSVWLSYRSPIELTVIKDRNTLYRQLSTGQIENVFQLKFINKSMQPITLTLNTTLENTFSISGGNSITLMSQQSYQKTLVIKSPVDYNTVVKPFNFILKDAKTNNVVLARKSNFHALSHTQ
ncbi:cytochrome c oxidase accessory protein CcoG [Thalassotalea sp. PP2-459]|uniref:cytochrome c oxidase accessory protein CcoG n=1 Tax=Thalassotalea sp. PP2-459 TaxID=1742724 RepID=UPI0009449417|nr:cytochrome c oxidase accessory protein CcoG [Thalassotalea sp. PP2-459]OKY25409.1 cytochrome c oxidase accessory protein CcoG [Thalassotalea sp. PP2-459]